MARLIFLGADTVGGADDVRAILNEASGCGFHGVEWGIVDAPDVSSLHSSLKVINSEAVSDSTAEGNSPVHSLSAALSTVDPAEATDELVRVLGAVQGLCVQTLALTIPPLRPAGDGRGFSRYREGLSFAYQVLRGVRFEAEAAGVRVAIEAAQGGCLLSPVEVRDLIDAVNSSAISACVDVDLVGLVGDPVDWLGTLGSRIGVVRVGSQGPPVELLATALDELRFGGPVVVKRGVSVEDRRGLVERLSESSIDRPRNLAEGSDSS